MLQTVFQSIFPVAEKPKLGFAFTLISGMADILLNAFFIIGCWLGSSGCGSVNRDWSDNWQCRPYPLFSKKQ